MSQETEIRSLALCYFRNLVARCYREARYLGTTGKYPPMEQFYQACRYRLAYGRTWVEPLFARVAAEKDIQAIQSAFAERLDGLTLEQLAQAFACGTWSNSMGGARWAEIVNKTIALGRCLEQGETEDLPVILSSIDALRHNTGQVVADFLQPCR